ncbi:Spermidine synthase-like protein [Gordonia bronchialis DSM 43247]|uniref:Spermidine synthase-like protein n=1 Tax=Gordonia bronchialis (strain ATCC 25592 / DSM 43247 / BCRC 13721 / JCM 3198 / KCTC 3076 / NBRC 16047 / NCTC 10667) TaxID=526226 RepID=D0LB16_GORB4|nr:fused MFS/spermidine synthase [Gordonia bronchialis]ACY22309.1 Spermidine synthase-like protein [Gordonia bronchialis DSM 43247]MCC3325100.1 fused MFS/spermidine synthase [Gordonia bronchialis]QGS24159.1 spermidine synthase [Gordonia bronchialis]STQ65235.1 spermidine synthase [Gordonia bronchialis]
MARTPPHPVAGTYPIDGGTAELAPDPVAGGWLLTINGTHSSHIHPDPTLLDFEYLRQMAAVIEDRHDTGSRLRVLHLGAAACALPRCLASRFPDARQVAVEIDAELARLVREWFDLPRAPLLRIRVGDARAVTTSLQPATREIVVRDAFVGDRTPRHLTTREFASAVHDVLVPGGLYLANCGDGRRLEEARTELATIASVFQNVMVIADPPMLKGRRTGNVVLAGSDGPLTASAALVRRLLSDPLPARVVDGPEARAFGSGVRHDVHSGTDAGVHIEADL